MSARLTVIDIYARVIVTDEHWVWIGGATNDGYPRFGKDTLAYRWFYEYFVGPIPEGMTIDHDCNYTMCVRPDHLVPMSIGDHIRRARAQIRACPSGHPYTEENTVVYTAPGDGRTRRYCRACQRVAA